MRIRDFIDWSKAAFLGLGLAVCTQALPAKELFPIVYLQRAEDPFYERHRVYTGLKLRDRHRPLAGAKVAIRESRILGRAMGLGFELTERSLKGMVSYQMLRSSLIGMNCYREKILSLRRLLDL